MKHPAASSGVSGYRIPQVARLPVSIRIVLESVLRNCDGKKVTAAHVEQLAHWLPNAARTEEIPFVVSHVGLHLGHSSRVKPAGRMKTHCGRCCLCRWVSLALARHLLKHPIDHTDVKVHMAVQAGAEPVDEGDRTDAQTCSVSLCRTGAVFMQTVLDDPQKQVQGRVECRPVGLHEVAQPLRD